ncbi:hypothetical protein DPMN_109386 [Dreissena polymorpha]|uniref:Uncharacterized protein n=1 Tax=Dreissena polymorpha TaxID=45954 RepID=A0A9D4KA67_DREPO|nr:hypothetical protein DPMN_109386 [Dreissena polymorpha]
MPVASRQSAGLLMHRSYTGTLSAFTGAPPGHHRRQPGVAVALPRSVRFIPEVFHIFLLVVPGSSRSSPVEPRFISVRPRFIPVDPGSRTEAPPAS